jgi:sugar/nucleoside kinase (ribokinase family)
MFGSRIGVRDGIGNQMAKYNIVSIGDTTIDAFIELHEASVNCAVDHTDCQLCMSYANKIPYEKLTLLPAGNSTNNSIGSRRLGMKAAFITGVGDDPQGQTIIEKLKKEKVDTSKIQINKGGETNFHFVLNFQGERTILIKHNKLDYKLPKKLDTKWIYFSSMAQGTEKFHREFGKFLKKNPKIKLSFNPGTFQMRMGTGKLREIYKRTEVLALNREEAQLVLKQQTRNIKTLLKGMHKLGTKIAVITDGREGSYASDGDDVWYMSEYPGPKIEATGAGDSYGTAFTAALFYDRPIEEALAWGTINGGNVVLHVGPHEGLQSRKQIQSYIKRHKKFRARKI